MSDSRSGHDLGRGAVRSPPQTELQFDDGGAAAEEPTDEARSTRSRTTIGEALDAHPEARALVEGGIRAGGTGMSPRAENDSGRGVPSREEPAGAESAAPESNEPFAWTGTWDEAAAERDRLRAANEDTSDIQAWLNANEPAERREERLSAQQPAEGAEEEQADMQVAAEALGVDPSVIRAATEPEEPEEPGEPGEEPEERSLSFRERWQANRNQAAEDRHQRNLDKIRRQAELDAARQEISASMNESIMAVLGLEGERGSAAIATLAMVLEGLRSGWEGTPNQIMEMAAEDYRTRRDDQLQRRRDSELAATGRYGDLVNNELGEGRAEDDHQRTLDLMELDQEFRRELETWANDFTREMANFENMTTQQQMTLANEFNQQMTRLENEMGQEMFRAQLGDQWEHRLREIQDILSDRDNFARAVQAEGGATRMAQGINHVTQAINAGSVAFGALKGKGRSRK